MGWDNDHGYIILALDYEAAGSIMERNPYCLYADN